MVPVSCWAEEESWPQALDTFPSRPRSSLLAALVALAALCTLEHLLADHSLALHGQRLFIILDALGPASSAPSPFCTCWSLPLALYGRALEVLYACQILLQTPSQGPWCSFNQCVDEHMAAFLHDLFVWVWQIGQVDMEATQVFLKTLTVQQLPVPIEVHRRLGNWLWLVMVSYREGGTLNTELLDLSMSWVLGPQTCETMPSILLYN